MKTYFQTFLQNFYTTKIWSHTVPSKIGYILTGEYLDPMISQKEISVSLCLVMTQVNCAVPAIKLLLSADDPVTNVEDHWNNWYCGTIGHC